MKQFEKYIKEGMWKGFEAEFKKYLTDIFMGGGHNPEKKVDVIIDTCAYVFSVPNDLLKSKNTNSKHPNLAIAKIALAKHLSEAVTRTMIYSKLNVDSPLLSYRIKKHGEYIESDKVYREMYLTVENILKNIYGK